MPLHASRVATNQQEVLFVMTVHALVVVQLFDRTNIYVVHDLSAHVFVAFFDWAADALVYLELCRVV